MASFNDTTLKEVPKCTLCDCRECKLHCDTCRLNLCAVCVSEHLMSQLTVQHNIVSFEMRDKDIKQPICQTHTKFSCDLYCEVCSVPACSQCCTDAHKDHTFTEIKDLLRIKQEAIKHEIDVTDRLIIPEYETIISDINMQISKLRNEYQMLRKSVVEWGETWQQEVQNVVRKIEFKSHEMEADDIDLLEKHRCEMEMALKTLHEIKQTDNVVLNSNDGDEFLKYESKIEDVKHIPASIKITTPTFIPKKVPEESLNEQFGFLTVSTASLVDGYTLKIADDVSKPIKPDLETTSSITKEIRFEKSITDFPSLSLPDNVVTPTVAMSIQTEYSGLQNLTCQSAAKIWVSRCNSREIVRINGEASCQEIATLNSEFSPYDMTINKKGNLVFTDWENGVYEVNKGKATRFITFSEWSPKGICSTADDCLLLCMTRLCAESKVVRYSGSSVKQEIMYNEKGRNLYDTGSLFVTENKNKDIWVSDGTAKALIVTDKMGKFKMKYTGDQSNKHKTFDPRYIDSDSRGNVFVIDRDNQSVHIINRKGNLLSYIQTLNKPQALCVDSNDQLWICEWWGKLKVVNYLS